MNSGTLEVIAQTGDGPSAPVILDRQKRAHPGQETDERIRRIAKGLAQLSQTRLILPEVDTHDLNSTLRAIHTEGYLKFLAFWSEKLGPNESRIDEQQYRAPGVEADTPIVQGIYDLARQSARSAIAAARQVANGSRYVYALCRPPGHHAGPNWLGGYCYLNNAVAAVRTLLDGGFDRIGVIDLDFHFGNGSAALLEEATQVFYGSVHSSTEISYPYQKTQPPNARQVYLPFDHSPTADEFLLRIERLLEEALAFGSAALVVSIGYDIIARDPHGTWNLPTSILHEVGQRFAATRVPLCLVQEGGYLLSELEDCSFQLGRGLLGGSNG